MSLGDLTKQLAVQALAGPDRPAKSESPALDTPGATMLAQLQAMQKALKEDEELVVLFRQGPETVVVREVYFPSWQVAVLAGVDGNRATTRVVTSADVLQLVCKVVKVPPPNKAVRVALIPPRTKSE